MGRGTVSLLIVLLAGCGELRSPTAPPDGGTPGPPIDPSATFTRVQNEIFTTTCAFSGCHGALGTQLGLNLTEGAAYGNLVNVPSAEVPQLDRVEPEQPGQSYLYLKVTGSPDILGGRMPLGQPELSQQQKDLIENWILRGAPND